MYTTAKERLVAYLTTKKISTREFERRSGLSNGYLKSLRANPSVDKLSAILKAYPDLNRIWLLTGEGSMLVSSSRVENPTSHEKKSPSHADESTKEEEMVKVLPIAAHGGSLTGFAEAANDYDCEWMPSPFKGADFAIDVVGDSMAPEYPSGSRVIIKRINDAAFIEWGKVYVLDTENGVVLKKVVHTEKSDSLHCVSLNPNPDYAPFDIPRSSIYGIYRVLGLLAKK